MSRLPKFVLKSPELQEEIKAQIVRKIDGMFLLAQLHLESIVGEMSPKSLRTALATLPKGPAGYDLSYQQAMDRSEGQIQNSTKLAKRVISWIVYARRPLTSVELRHALAVELGETRFDESNLPDIDDMVSVCAGLVIVDQESDIIRLVHYTTQEYFERTAKVLFPDAQRDITEICVTYLSFGAFEEKCQESCEFLDRLRDFPLYDYSAMNWGYHARNVSTVTQQLILQFLENKDKASSSHQVMINPVTRVPRTFFSSPAKLKGAHLAAYFGLSDIMELLIGNGIDPDCKDSQGRTPLSYAAREGHLNVAESLLKMANVYPNSEDMFGWKPLTEASAEGHVSIVQAILDNSLDPDAKKHSRDVPLALAAFYGHEPVVRLLLDSGFDVHGGDDQSRPPLVFASCKGHAPVVRLLLDYNADTDARGCFNETALMEAISIDHEQIVQMLLQNGADANARNTSGPTPLQRARARKKDGIIQLLLKHGALETED
ncbi:MAG: hypothetical protein Q9160_000315 [Pyrenula sp. 1 TL-2023]